MHRNDVVRQVLHKLYTAFQLYLTGCDPVYTLELDFQGRFTDVLEECLPLCYPYSVGISRRLLTFQLNSSVENRFGLIPHHPSAVTLTQYCLPGAQDAL